MPDTPTGPGGAAPDAGLAGLPDPGRAPAVPPPVPPLMPSGVPSGGARDEIRRHLRATAAAAALLAFGVGGWAVLTRIDGAVVAGGQLIVESEVKKVQHPTGGVVGELCVRDGDHVRAGQVLIRLDETQLRASRDIVLRALDQALARQARDEAEQAGEAAVAFPDEVRARAADPVVAHALESEARLFATRRAGRDGRRAQLGERVGQLREEDTGLREQVEAKTREIALIAAELQGVRDLRARNLVPLSRLTALERDATRLGGERGQLVASRAQVAGRITETGMQIAQIDDDLSAEVGKDLVETRGRVSELREKTISAEDQLRRTDLRAPQDGVVHQMSVHTVGGVVTASEPALLIVPTADALVAEARIRPEDIDHVRLGQPAVLRFPAFNPRTTPEIRGAVSRVSADVTQDPRTGQSYYTARIRVPDAERARLGGVRLVPGMPVESFIRTGARTVLAYLTKPLADQAAKAWREP